MNPITHACFGWLIAQPLQTRRDRILVTIAAVAPDLDGLTLLGGIDYYGKWHHTFGHNVFAAVATAAVCGVAANSSKGLAALLGLVAFHSHILADLFGSGAGWPIEYFWPASGPLWEFRPPFQWELDSWQNFCVTFVCLVLIAVQGKRRGRTIVEVFSVKGDARVVEAIKGAIDRALKK